MPVEAYTYHVHRSVQQLAASDATFQGFLSQCLAAPTLCPLARLEQPGKTLHQQVSEAIEQIKYRPLAVGTDALISLVDYNVAKGAIGQYLYGGFEQLALFLELLVTRNDNGFARYASRPANASDTAPSPFPENVGIQREATNGIRCADNTLRANNLDEVMLLIQEFYKTSTTLGDWLAVPQPLTCPQWKIAAKERYAGGFINIATSKPLLFIGNTFDPIMSLSAARNASALFEGSRLLVHNGYGVSGRVLMTVVCSCTNFLASILLSGSLLFAPPELYRRTSTTALCQTRAPSASQACPCSRRRILSTRCRNDVQTMTKTRDCLTV